MAFSSRSSNSADNISSSLLIADFNTLYVFSSEDAVIDFSSKSKMPSREGSSKINPNPEEKPFSSSPSPIPNYSSESPPPSPYYNTVEHEGSESSREQSDQEDWDEDVSSSEYKSNDPSDSNHSPEYLWEIEGGASLSGISNYINVDIPDSALDVVDNTFIDNNKKISFNNVVFDYQIPKLLDGGHSNKANKSAPIPAPQ
ncbi:MAG: hypothetical protein QNL35_06985, partial [Emcibacteraceae bacterium]